MYIHLEIMQLIMEIPPSRNLCMCQGDPNLNKDSIQELRSYSLTPESNLTGCSISSCIIYAYKYVTDFMKADIKFCAYKSST
jgi:hypothetical protein